MPLSICDCVHYTAVASSRGYCLSAVSNVDNALINMRLCEYGFCPTTIVGHLRIFMLLILSQQALTSKYIGLNFGLLKLLGIKCAKIGLMPHNTRHQMSSSIPICVSSLG